MPTTYLYVQMEGSDSCCVSDDPPVVGDREFVETGLLEIFRIGPNGIDRMRRDGSWGPVPPGLVTSVEPPDDDEEPHEPFHQPIELE